MEIKYYKLTEAAKILTPLAPGATELQMRNYLYSRVGRGVSAKINKHPITDRKDIKIIRYFNNNGLGIILKE